MKKQNDLPKLIVKDIEQPREIKQVEVKAAYESLDECSITPRTFKSRNFKESLEDVWFTDIYEFDSKTITSFRINKDKVPKSKQEEADKKDNKKILGDVEVKVIEKKASSVNSKTYTEADLKKVEYTNVEK